MAFQAIGPVRLIELPVVDIPVTVETARGQLRKDLVPGSPFILPVMAGPARLLQMGPFQSVPGPVVVEGNFCPGIRIVAVFTAAVRVVLFIQVGIMDIRMAVRTTGTDLPETPFPGFFMAGEAGSSQVGACKLEGAAVMLIDGVQGLPESHGGMAFGTVRRAPPPGELTFMIIGMAIRAAVMFQGSGEVVPVALGTGYRAVFSFKGKTGHGMREISCLPDPVEGFLGMALHAVLPEFVLVDIPVAVCAVRIGNSGKLLRFDPVLHVFPMAFDAIHLPVAPCEREISPVMVKIRRRPECPEIVA